MRLGLLADIHEEVDLLLRAIEALHAHGVTRFIVLGDIFETGKTLEKTTEILSQLDSVGVWGNHDYGLCRDVEEWTRRRFSPQVLEYFGGLKPWLEVAGCRFQHIEPFLDSEQIEDLWSYGGDGKLDATRSFAACPNHRMFMGHVHRWELLTPDGIVRWSGEEPIRLNPAQRYLVVVHAVQQGWCGYYDTDQDLLCPLRVD